MSDQLFKKKKNSLKRRKAIRKSYPRILISCEGKKTETQYFNFLAKKLGIPSLCIENPYSDPKSIVENAKKRVREEEIKDKEPFKYVYCVFDKDSHGQGREQKFDEAIYEARRFNKENNDVEFHTIPSIECIEIWLIFHFEKISGELSTDDAKKKLKQYRPEYDKGIDKELVDKFETAIKNAKAVEKEQRKYNSANPSSKVYIIVEKLLEIQREFKGNSVN